MYPGDDAWYFVTIPKDYAAEIRAVSGPRRGFGSVSVAVTIGDSTWRTSIFPDKKSGSYFLPVKKDIRTKHNLIDGSKADLRLQLV